MRRRSGTGANGRWREAASRLGRPTRPPPPLGWWRGSRLLLSQLACRVRQSRARGKHYSGVYNSGGLGGGCGGGGGTQRLFALRMHGAAALLLLRTR
ncbi:hypothetical protein T492DRAFT_864573 [Pavlovales sp. CCMP2436]|nr:hypothetical protein T492DRAFT_864573 [Pavlovales sp. CCMP2436]